MYTLMVWNRGTGGVEEGRKGVSFGTGVAGCRLFCLRLVRAMGSWQLGGEPRLSLVTLCEASSELTIAAML